MRTRSRRAAGAVAALLGVVLAVVAPVFACVPVAEITADRTVVRPGSQVLLDGRNFRSGAGPIEISLSDGTKGVALTSVGATFSFRVRVAVPLDTPPSTDPYFFVAEQRDLAGALILRASAEIFVQSGARSPTPSLG